MRHATFCAALLLAGLGAAKHAQAQEAARAPVAAEAQDAALRAVRACRARLDARVDVGIDRVRRRCPDLMPALEKASWRNLLPSTLGERREEISAQSLRALEELVTHALDAGAQRAAPDTQALAPVLAELGERGQQGATRWERFKRWLKKKLEDRPDEEAGWLVKWTRQFRADAGIAEIITYVGYALVVALTLFVVWQELRAAGLWGVRRAAQRGGAAAQWRRRLMLADVLEAPLADRPGMLLRLLGEALARAHRLPAAEGLTAAAIVRRARLDTETDREALAVVARTADQVRYAPRPPGQPAIEGAVATARELLGRFARMTERKS
ncbi:MAG TPA: hypothetical protein VFP37_00590 [Steroidobacteraceae bacterium]|nr:hypothetical protein [Steroidobacteraceae bacterium]